MATAQSPNDLTRQQLDELDALLQRMLALPLNPPETPAPVNSRATVPDLLLPEVEPPSVRVHTPPAYTPSIPSPVLASAIREVASPTLYRGEASTPVGPQLLTVATPGTPSAVPASRPSPPTQTRTAPPATSPSLSVQTIEQALAGFAKAQHNPPPASPVSQALNVAVPPVVTKRRDAVPALLTPLVSFNRVVNLCLDRLGLVGRVLQTGFARNLLALAGFALLASMAAKILEIQGWASSPVSFPWHQ